MAPDNPSFVEMRNDISEIKAALVGDALSGRVGIIQHHNRMMEDVYGLDSHGEPLESKKNTLLLRVSDLEDSTKKVKWIFGGAVFAALAAKFGISALIEKYWK